MSGKMMLSQLPSGSPTALVTSLVGTQTSFGIYTDISLPIPSSGVPPASVTATSGTGFTAAQMLTGAILRSGPTANFSDTTDTAANIVAALGLNVTVNNGFDFTIANYTAFTETLSGATGVTITAYPAGTAAASQNPGTIGPSDSVTFRVTVTAIGSSPAVTLTRIASGGV
ncbi:MAG: hypothetical protein ACYDDA_10825 [Acidiferrobacteraceae bacterium]